MGNRVVLYGISEDDGKKVPIVITEDNEVKVDAEVTTTTTIESAKMEGYDGAEWRNLRVNSDGEVIIDDFDALLTQLQSMQGDEENLQDIIDAIEALQDENETLQDIIDELDEIKQFVERDTTIDETNPTETSAAGTDTLTATGAFEDFGLEGEAVIILRGPGAGQTRRIKSNTDDTLTLYRDWDVQVTTNSVFIVIESLNAKFGRMVEEPNPFSTLGRLKTIAEQDIVEEDEIVNEKVSFEEGDENEDTEEINVPEPAELRRGDQYYIYVYNGSPDYPINVFLEVPWEDADSNIRKVIMTLYEGLGTEESEEIMYEAKYFRNGGKIIVENTDTVGSGEDYNVYVKVVKV